MSFHRRASVACLGAALTLAAAVSHAGINSWTLKGPPGGQFHDVEASTTHPNVFYAAYSRTVHRTTDGGATWSTVREFPTQVNEIAVDPTNGDRFYVSVLDTGLFRSDDRGQSFVQVAPSGSGLWGVGTNGSAVYYSNGVGEVYRSLDRGQTWSLRTQPVPTYTLNKILVDPHNADLLYAFTGPYFLRSTDGGATWPSSPPKLTGIAGATVYDLAQLSSTQFIAACGDGLYLSADSGATWTLAHSGSFNSVAADPATPGRAVASSWSRIPLQVTTNYGVNWVGPGAIPADQVEGVRIGSQGTRIVTLGQQLAQYSTNGGQTWTEAGESPVASQPMQFATTLAGNSKVYTYTLGGYDGLFATQGDAGWQRLNLQAAQALSGGGAFGQARLAVKPGTPNTIYLGAFNRGVYRSLDGGQSWSTPNFDLSGFAPQAFAFDPDDSDIMYVNVSTAGSIPTDGLYRSTDGGITWGPHSINLPNDVYGMDLRIDPADPTRMFLAALQSIRPAPLGGLYRSTDRGLSWTQSFNGQDAYAVAIDPAHPSRIYLATQSGLHASDDSGDTFSILTDQPASGVAIDPVVPTTIYTTRFDPGYSFGARNSSSLLRSVDSGQTWEVLRSASEPTTWYAGALALDPNNPALIYVATGVRGTGTFEVAPDLRVEISGHDGTRPKNYESTFNLRAVNSGPYAATAVRLSATLPAGLSNVSITTDRGTCTATTTVSCTVPVLRVEEEVNAVVRYTTPADAVTLPITATVAAHENDAVASDNSAQASALAGEPGDLSVAISPSASSVTRGSNVTYTVTVTNHGSTASSAGNVTFNVSSAFTLGTLPSGCSSSAGGASCALGAIAPSATQILTFTAVATNTGSADATATVALDSSQVDINLADNSATSSVTATVPTGSGNSGGGGGGAMNLVALLALLVVSRIGRRPVPAPDAND